jgi:hypothetical protein
VSPLVDLCDLAESEDTGDDFRRALARGLIDLDLNYDVRENLTLQLSLSLWMRLAGADLALTRWELLELRRNVLDVSGLDSRTEPVPMHARDDARAVLNLSVYLLELIDRAAHAGDVGRTEIVESALAQS